MQTTNQTRSCHPLDGAEVLDTDAAWLVAPGGSNPIVGQRARRSEVWQNTAWLVEPDDTTLGECD